MPRTFSSVLAFLVLVAFTAVCTLAQRTASGTNTTSSAGTGSIMVRVSGDDGQPLDVTAEVRVYAGGGGAGAGGAIIQNTADGGRVTVNALAAGEYAVEASAPGYKTGSGETVDVEGRGMIYSVDVRLERDTSSTDKTYSTAGPILTPKAQQAEDRGVAALKAGNLEEAQHDLEETLKLAPANPNANFLLGYIFFQEKNAEQAEIYLMKAYSLDPKHVQTLVALGQLRFQQGNFAKAIELLKAAVSENPKEWFAHWILANADLRQQDFEAARQEAQLAVQLGKGAADGAQLIQGEALAGLGRTDEAIQILELFLKDEPNNSSVPKAQALVASLKGGGAQPSPASIAAPAAAAASGPAPSVAP